MTKPKISEIPSTEHLSAEQKAALAAQLQAEIENGVSEKPVLQVPRKPLDFAVKTTPVAEVIEASEKLPEGSVPAQVLSPETHPQALSMKQQLENMLNARISGPEAEAAMAKLINSSKN